jgi:ABC-type multidrug transport system permease subunit
MKYLQPKFELLVVISAQKAQKTSKNNLYFRSNLQKKSPIKTVSWAASASVLISSVINIPLIFVRLYLSMRQFLEQNMLFTPYFPLISK